MVNIIVAFPAEAQCQRYAAVLEEAGYSVFRRCTSLNEVKRALNQCGDGLILCSCRLPDGTVDALAWDLGSRAVILALGRPEQLELCEHPRVFRLTMPCSRGELLSAVNMLSQLRQMNLRSPKERDLIARAKEYLMKQYAMTEPEAHHSLQKGAMDKGLKLAEYAERLIKATE